ncbi:MAG: mercuric reductase [Trebouxia sp. A1-2]|nr:MAG: mercuric reductase [Trebouxia sp. A1-2]
MADDDDEHLKEVTEKLKQGLEVKDRRYRLKTYKQVFLGTDAVNFFLAEKYATNIADAVALGSELMAAGIFQHCLRDHPFKNEPLFYRFVDQDIFHGGCLAYVLAVKAEASQLVLHITLDSVLMKPVLHLSLLKFMLLKDHLKLLLLANMGSLLRPDGCRVPITEDGKGSSWADVLTPQQSGGSQYGAQSLQASLPQEVVLQYDQGQKQCVLSPLDSHNVKLLDNVHPSQWTNPDTADKYNLVVIGAGAGGLVTAAGAAGVGARVAIIEEHLMGGDCLNVGCVPSKALIRCARAAHEARTAGQFGVEVDNVRVNFGRVMERMRELRAKMSANDSARRFASMGVDVYQGHATFTSKHSIQVAEHSLKFATAVIASGGTARIPAIPGLKVVPYLTNATIFNLTELPARFGVIGAGPIGLELAQCMARFGSKVTVFAKSGEILGKEDRDAAALLYKQLQADGVEFRMKARYHMVHSGGPEGQEIHVQLLGLHKDQAKETIIVDALLVATGRSPNVSGLGLDAAGVQYDEQDGIKTTNGSIYAVGDCCTAYKFTHVADFMARMVVRNALFFAKGKMSAMLIPWTTFTQACASTPAATPARLVCLQQPEVAHVGLYQDDLTTKGIKFDTYTRQLKDVDRALLDGETDGFVRILCKAGTDCILGATVVAADAGNIISEISLAIETKTGLSAIAAVIHPYPTQAEAIRQCGDQYNKTRLSPLIKSMLRKVIAVQS